MQNRKLVHEFTVYTDSVKSNQAAFNRPM